jgi:16S rRNA (cytosine967-C5)-methyltransferase
MKLAIARQAAYGALLAVERGKWSAEALTEKSLHLDPRDAGLASDIVFGTLRRRGELDFLIAGYASRPVEKIDTEARIALEMALYQMRFLDRVPDHAAVNDAVELVRRAGKEKSAAFVNAVLRQSLRDPSRRGQPDVALSIPAWILDRWKAQYGEEIALGIVLASVERPERYIRAGNAEPPVGAEATDVPGCYRLNTGDPAPFRFQDISSQAVVPLLDLQPGQTFLDLCAAPGNKTSQALEIPLDAIACDTHESRARMLLSLCIPIVVLDATKPLPFDRKFDRILVDAPCTGTGTFARNPEIKFRLNKDDIFDLRRKQKAILRNALAALQPDGLLVYSTCSLEREENEDVIEASGAKVVETMRRIPGRDAGDGFFAAALKSAPR